MGRVLSGWDPEHGGVCPSASALPVPERAQLNILALGLFGTVNNMSTQFMECLTCVLLMHYNGVVRDFPDHSIVTKIKHTAVTFCSVSSDKLTEWSEIILGSYQRVNSLYLPRRFMRSSGGNNSSSDSVIDERLSHCAVLERTVYVVETLHQNVSELSTQITTLTAVIRGQDMLIKQLAENQLLLQQQLQAALTAGQLQYNTTISSHQTVTPQHPTTTVMRQRQGTLLAAGFETTNSASVRTTQPPPGALFSDSLAKVGLEQLFTDWFKWELFLHDTTLTEARRRMGQFATLIGYCKLFLPPGTILTSKPTATPTNTAALKDWLAQIGAHAAYCQAEIRQFITKYKSSARSPAMTVLSVLKALNRIPSDKFPQPSNVVDRVTSAEFNYSAQKLRNLESKRLADAQRTATKGKKTGSKRKQPAIEQEELGEEVMSDEDNE